MVLEKAELINASHVYPYLSQATDKALLNAFLASRDTMNDWLRSLSYHFVVHILKELATKGGLDEIFDCNIGCRVQSSTFMDAFDRRALTSSQFLAHSQSALTGMWKKPRRQSNRIYNYIVHHFPLQAHRHHHLSLQLKINISNTRAKSRSSQIMPRATLRPSAMNANATSCPCPRAAR